MQFSTFLAIRDALLESGMADAAEIAEIARELRVFAENTRTAIFMRVSNLRLREDGYADDDRSGFLS